MLVKHKLFSFLILDLSINELHTDISSPTVSFMVDINFISSQNTNNFNFLILEWNNIYHDLINHKEVYKLHS